MNFHIFCCVFDFPCVILFRYLSILSSFFSFFDFVFYAPLSLSCWLSFSQLSERWIYKWFKWWGFRTVVHVNWCFWWRQFLLYEHWYNGSNVHVLLNKSTIEMKIENKEADVSNETVISRFTLTNTIEFLTQIAAQN